MNTLTEKQNLRYDLLKANSYDVKNSKACYDFVTGNETVDPPEAKTANGLVDGIYLMQSDGMAILFTGQNLSDTEKSLCTGIGIKQGDKSLVVALVDAYEEDTELTKEKGGSGFITNYHKAVADWDGKGNTERIGKNLHPNIKLNTNEFVPSLGQLYFILLHFDAINEALEAVGGKVLRDDWYWSSTEYSATNAWYLLLGNGNANGITKAASLLRVRAVSAFLPLNI